MDLKELKSIANLEMLKHGLHGWTFGFANTKRRLGVCKYRNRRIEIAEFYAQHSPPESVMDTLFHEIAHALAGPAANHGPKWKAIAIRLGATPRACETSNEAVVKPGDWQATCHGCRKTFHRYRRPKRSSRYHCRCTSHSPLVFEFKGDPARRPPIPRAVEQQPNWEARCTGCQTLHLRIRRPKPGIWYCRCPQRCEIAWRRRKPEPIAVN